jgi:anaerobic ribonucleoside-triphosphate reductase activating protein
LKTINIHSYISQTRTLGPFLRFALWVQGCPFHCPDCMTPNALPESGGKGILISELAQLIKDTPEIEGLTLTGGEPFAQATVLVKLIEQIRQSKDLGVIVYSGYTLKKLQHLAACQPDIAAFLQVIDLLIDGQYITALNDGGSLRGSSNQQIHLLTKRYATVINDYYGQSKRPVEIHLTKDDIMLVGVPGEETLKKWQNQFR